MFTGLIKVLINLLPEVNVCIIKGTQRKTPDGL